jgi:Holliday junction resolvasome RuvABC endonuclease subunit
LGGEIVEYNDRLVLVGIDPSLDNLGFAVLVVDVDTKNVYIPFVETFYGKKQIKSNPVIVETHGDRTAKQYTQRENLIRQFNIWKPDCVSVEQPFLGRFPAAYGSLMECMSVIKSALIDYMPIIPLMPIDPPNVKLAVGVAHNSKDKDEMIAAVKVVDDITYDPSIDLDSLDEHSCDAIAVGYWLSRKLLGVYE